MSNEELPDSDQPDTEQPTLPPRNQSLDRLTTPPATSRGEHLTLPPLDADATLAPNQDSGEAKIGDRIQYFGDYELLEEIARGGMGVVFKARQVNLNRIVALKMILAGQFAGEEDVQRFYTEAEAAAQLDHPGIVPIFEIGEHDGQHYFSMGYIEGESLAEKVADGPLPPTDAAGLVKQICGAMQYAHEHGVIHRDLKPANILIDRNGKPKVTDFGLAKKTKDDSNLTGTGQILGTPAYMPPEQASGKTEDVGSLADVYSLGAILYCLLTGRPPFQAASPLDTLMQVIEQEPVPPRRLNAKLPRNLETICLKCLHKTPSRRYQTAAELKSDLTKLLNGEPITARPAPWWEVALMWGKRQPAIASFVCFYLLVYVVSIFGFIGVIIRNDRLITAANECLSWALSCSVFGALLGLLGTVFGNIFAKQVYPREALMRGFIYGAAIGGFLGIALPVAGALGGGVSERAYVMVTPLWASFVFGAFLNFGRSSEDADDESSLQELAPIKRILGLGRRVSVLIGILYVSLLVSMLLLVDDPASLEIVNQRRLEVIKNMPFLTILLIIIGGFTGVVFSLAGAVLAAIRDGNFADRRRRIPAVGGQFGMIGGMLSGTLITVQYVVTRPPASKILLVDGSAVWQILMFVVLPPVFVGLLSPATETINRREG